MKLPFKAIEGFIKSPTPDIVAVLIYGPDEGLVRERMTLLSKTVVDDPNDAFNVVEFSGDELSNDPARLLDEAQSISMMGGRRVIRVRNASDKATDAIKTALDGMKEGDNLVLIESDNLNPRSTLRMLFEKVKNVVALPCYVEDERDITRVIKTGLTENGFQISSDALSYMAANVVGDRGVVRSEIEKIITYMGEDENNIGIDHVMACVGNSAALSMDLLCMSTASGDYAAAERVNQFLLSEGEPAVRILRALQRYFNRLYMTRLHMDQGLGLDSAMGKLKPPVFWKNKAPFQAQVSGWTTLSLEQALSLITTVEAKCKQTGSNTDTLCSRALLALTQMAGRAMARGRRAGGWR